MSNKTVLFFGKLPPPFTGENVVSNSIIQLLAKEFDVSVINTSGIIEKKNGFFNKLIYYSNQSAHLIRCFIRLWFEARRKKFQYLYFCGSSSFFGNTTDILVVFLTRRYTKKIICHLHRGNYQRVFTQNYLLNSGKFLATNIDSFIFLSNLLSNDLKGYIDDRKRKVLPNPIDKSILLSNEEFDLRQKNFLAREKFVITYLSNFIVSKGYMNIVHALKLLQPSLKNKIIVRFIGAWVDSAVEKNKFFEEIQSEELSSIIEYIGPVKDRQEIKTFLTESDIFCLPSYYELEAQPVSIIEAMNAGNAIISTYHASIPEYVEHKKVGLLVEKNNVNQLADAITAICDRDLLIQYSMNAREKFLNSFQEIIVEEKLFQIFRNT